MAEARERPVPSVEVVRPKTGGIPRTIQQPASIHSFESVNLYAMVSGYLKRQDVDIGSWIKKGEVLAEINVPRDAKAVEEAASLVEQARAQVVQAEARIRMAEAQRDAATAAARVAESDLERLVARRKLAEKQYARISGWSPSRRPPRGSRTNSSPTSMPRSLPSGPVPPRSRVPRRSSWPLRSPSSRPGPTRWRARRIWGWSRHAWND